MFPKKTPFLMKMVVTPMPFFVSLHGHSAKSWESVILVEKNENVDF